MSMLNLQIATAPTKTHEAAGRRKRNILNSYIYTYKRKEYSNPLISNSTQKNENLHITCLKKKHTN